MKITPKEIFNDIIEALKKNYSKKERNTIALLLLEELFNLTIADLIINEEKSIPSSSLQQIENCIGRLIDDEPIQYILGQVKFYNCKLHVNNNVLIPRPETEELVDIIFRENKGHDNLEILDLCTGSGCIAIALAKNLNKANVTAIDNSKSALKVAKKNAIFNNTNVEFVLEDILKFEGENKLKKFHKDSIFSKNLDIAKSDYKSIHYKNVLFSNKKWDIIVSNPPYVEFGEKKIMKKNVLQYEPLGAIFVFNTNPLIFYEKIINIASKCLKKKGKIYLEINEKYGEKIVKLFSSTFSKVKLIKDFNKKDRFVTAEK